MTAAIRVVIADDQRVVREGLTMVLELLDGIDVVGSASDGLEAVELAQSLRPDIVLMDLRMPRCDGVTATRRLTETVPEVRVVVLTTYSDDRSVIDALRAGARGYLTKDAGGESIREALIGVHADRAVIDPAVHHHLVDAISSTPPSSTPQSSTPPSSTTTAAAVDALPDGLTPREGEVLGLIAQGLTNADIAERLVISEATVKSHINRLFAKIGALSRAQAVGYAYRNKLL